MKIKQPPQQNFSLFFVYATKSKNKIKSLSYKILTLSDLNRLRNAGHSSSSANDENSDPGKRYFILCYQTPYDQVLYPLPLILYDDTTRIFEKSKNFNNSNIITTDPSICEEDVNFGSTPRQNLDMYERSQRSHRSQTNTVTSQASRGLEPELQSTLRFRK